MFYYETQWFYQDFKICFFNLYSLPAVRILELSLETKLSPPRFNSKGFSFMPEQV